MMLFKTTVEKEDTKNIVKSKYINWEYLKNSSFLVTGATGLIGKQIIFALLYANEILKTDIKIYALVRNIRKAEELIGKYDNLEYIVQDITEPIKINKKTDYIIHTANTTSSKEFVEQPAKTLNSIYIGTKNVLDFAKNANVESVIYLSSMEVYGNIDLSRKEPLKEEDYGYIDILNPRSSYPIGKRAAEALCSAYYNDGVPVKVARLAQTLGAGVDYNDNRVFAQFARNILEKKDIVLKTKGESVRNYIYVTDAITAIFAMLEKGCNGEAYNVANPDTTCSIKEMAEMLCEKYKTSRLKFELDDKYYPKSTMTALNVEKLTNSINWQPKISLINAYEKLIHDFEERKINA